MEVYLDNSATTRPYDEVVQVVCDTMLNNYGNASSLHRMGKNAEDLLTKSREYISSTVYCTPDELYFTSGGTESDNTAIIGYAMANRRRGNRVITQVTEHKAVLESFAYLEKNGFDVQYIGVDSNGVIDTDALRSTINDNTILVSLMAVNNETGAIQPIDAVSTMIDHGKCALHVDAVQAYGKIKINVKKSNIDMLTISAHKIHGPNGVGALYVKKGIKISPVIMGGQQEKSLRSGTENLAGIAGFARAAQIKYDTMEHTAETIGALKAQLAEGLCAIDGAVVNSPADSLYSILNVSFTGVRSEVLLHVLESKGIYVSSGSACNSKKNSASYVLSAMNLGRERVDSAIRFSLSEFTTEQEIQYVCGTAAKEVPLLAQIMNRR
ncbi:MAG: cysteine desulfurase [Clostridia bacterium]|nr:cysteine desulfurase [Clostridia bacterium]